MVNANLIRISLTSFLAYAVMACLMSPLGIISQPMSALFEVSLTTIVGNFSYITTGILAGSFIAVFIFDWFSVKTVVVANSAIVGAVILLLYLTTEYHWLPFLFVALGISSSINLTSAAVVITRIYSEGQRASMLLLTDCFYSIGGVGSSFFAAMLIARGNHWVSGYIMAFVLAVTVIFIAAISLYPKETSSTEQASPDQKTLQNERQSGGWPAPVFFCSASLFLYMIGMVSLYSWVPKYAQTYLGMAQESAGQLVSYMFGGMFVSQILMFLLVLRFPMGRLILISSGLAALMNFSLWHLNDGKHLVICIFILGVFAGGLLKTFITFGTLTVERASTRLVSFFMLSTGLGTAVAPAISAWVVEQSTYQGALVLSSFCYLATFLLACISVFLRKKQ